MSSRLANASYRWAFAAALDHIDEHPADIDQGVTGARDRQSLGLK